MLQVFYWLSQRQDEFARSLSFIAILNSSLTVNLNGIFM